MAWGRESEGWRKGNVPNILGVFADVVEEVTEACEDVRSFLRTGKLRNSA
jgi:hypothetical protein